MCDIFNFPWDKGTHMFIWKEKQNFCITQAGLACLKSSLEVLGQGVKYVQSYQERPQNNAIDVILES